MTFGTFPTVLDLAHTYIHTYIQLKTFIHLTNGVVSDMPYIRICQWSTKYKHFAGTHTTWAS